MLSRWLYLLRKNKDFCKIGIYQNEETPYFGETDFTIGFTDPMFPIQSIAYFAMVRSTLEYSSGMWDLYLQKDIDNVEIVNQRAARFVLDDHRQQSSVSVMIEKLIEYLTLEHRLCSRLSTVLWQK